MVRAGIVDCDTSHVVEFTKRLNHVAIGQDQWVDGAQVVMALSGPSKVTPQETIEFFKEVKRPWIAFKTLAAGAIHPRSGFDFAFKGGADFICVGMFDFQVVEDAQIASAMVAQHQQRERGWMA